jgi:hypothetical protein
LGQTDRYNGKVFFEFTEHNDVTTADLNIISTQVGIRNKAEKFNCWPCSLQR